MIAGPGGHADVGNSVLRRDPRHDRLRPVAPGHPDGVGALRDRVTHDRRKVIVSVQLDRLDPAGPRFVGDLEAFRFAAAGLRVVEQDWTGRRPSRGQLGVDRKHGARRGEREGDPRRDQHILNRPSFEHDQQNGSDEQQHASAGTEQAWKTAAKQRPPRRGDRDGKAREYGQPARKQLHGENRRQDDRCRHQQERRNRCEPAFHAPSRRRRSRARVVSCASAPPSSDPASTSPG